MAFRFRRGERLRAALREEARTDQMTGLANRTHALESIADLLRDPGRAFAVLLIGLDRFKRLNDAFGYDAGDVVLQTIAHRLAGDMPPAMAVTRFASDEFLVILTDANEAATQAAAADILERVREPVAVAGRDIVLTCSIGMALAGAASAEGPGDGATARTILRNARTALYAAKQQGRDRAVLFDDRFRRRALDRLILQEDLRKGLARDELWPAFQPIVSLQHKQVIAAEALARWTHPVRGSIPPTAFIPIAEETGLITELGQLILGRAAEQAALWRNTGAAADLVMSVNLSARQLADPEVAPRVRALLLRRDLPAEALNLEITETALMDDPDRAAETLRQLRDVGVGIALDDFGTGYSSLSYLRRFPVTSLKIDRSFVESIGRSPGDDAIVAGIISLSHTLGLRVVAEGVQTGEQLATLRELGCDSAQGFLFCEPVSADAFGALLVAPKPWPDIS